MGLIERAKKDVEKITTNKSDWAVDLTLYAPTGEIATIPGIHSKRNVEVQLEGGQLTNSKLAHVSFSEPKLLTDFPLYPLRDAKSQVHLKGHRVKVKDSTGTECMYMIREWKPDETIGLIVCILGDFDE